MGSEKVLIIDSPIVKNENGKSYLSAVIMEGAEEKKIAYCVDQEYGRYLTPERSDAFVAALLYYAMFYGYDIQWKTPCSEQFIYQLVTYYIPVCAAEIPYMHSVKLMGDCTSQQLDCKGGVGTGFSGGVDSCYTIQKYLESRFTTNKLTHLMVTDWYLDDGFEEKFRQDFLEKYIPSLATQAKELGLDFVFVDFQLDSMFSVGNYSDPECGEICDGGLNTLKFCSAVMALQKLFCTYYFSSGFSGAEFSFKTPTAAYYDMFTIPLISTDRLKFYSSGMEATRIKKVEAISGWKFAQKHLQVCFWDNETNCGRCSKCIGTMSGLYALGKLELFHERFPIDDYMKHFRRRWTHVLVEACQGHPFEQNIVKKMKETKRRIPFGSYLLVPFYIFKEMARIRFRKVKWARKIYHKFHLYRLLYGRSTEIYNSSLDRDVNKRK